MKMMKKRILMVMSAVLMMAVGVCGCSSDDDEELLRGKDVVYEENPTTLDGVWHMVQFSNGWGKLTDYNGGEVALKIDEAKKTIKVVNKLDGVFIPSGDYIYELTGHTISTINDEEDGEAVYYTIDIKAKDNPDAHYITCGCNFCDGGYLLFDDGMASDSPGYFFKKLAPEVSK